MAIVYEQMPEGASLSLHMPVWVKLEIAACVILFGRMEQKIVEVAWDVAGTSEVKERLKRAQQSSFNNFDEVLSTIEGAAGEKFDALRRAFNDIRKERNLIAHGSWLMADDKPYVVWHQFITDSDSVMGEFFEKGRFERFQAYGEQLLQTFRTWHDMISEQKGTTQSVLNRVAE